MTKIVRLRNSGSTRGVRHKTVQPSGSLGHCTHSLARHEEVPTSNGRTKTVSYALPCVLKRHEGVKQGGLLVAIHRDSEGREWT